ncbi:MAG: YheU family protein [Gammaproteobacteria bacterium]|jgi:hypothetical protein
MKIPHASLSADALHGIIEEYVSREGTEYGVRDFSLEEKVQQVLGQLQRGEIYVNFDPDTSTCNLLVCDQAPSANRLNRVDCELCTDSTKG